jgi:hypothetical protein
MSHALMEAFVRTSTSLTKGSGVTTVNAHWNLCAHQPRPSGSGAMTEKALKEAFVCTTLSLTVGVGAMTAIAFCLPKP